MYIYTVTTHHTRADYRPRGGVSGLQNICFVDSLHRPVLPPLSDISYPTSILSAT